MYVIILKSQTIQTLDMNWSETLAQWMYFGYTTNGLYRCGTIPASDWKDWGNHAQPQNSCCPSQDSNQATSKQSG